MKVLDSIEQFLKDRRATHNGPDLLDRWTPAMETQVNVSAEGGTAVEGMRNTWTDGSEKWWNIRAPKNAKTEPEFNDYELRWSLDKHVEAIGSTGWDWVAKRSRWLGFDFDAITGHAAGVGITADKLEAVKQAAIAVPWVELRKSTGGAGLHLYVYLAGEVATANHTEHAALGRAVLGMLSTEAGFDFASQIDACGTNMWVWHRKMNLDNEGLKLIKAAERNLTGADLPSNWRDHIDVVTRKRSKVRVRGIGDEASLESLAASRNAVPLDAKHKAVIERLASRGWSTIWVPDHHLLQAHSAGFAALANDSEASSQLGLIGVFQTTSKGSNPGQPNCFAFPLSDGAWKVYRFSPGVHEAETWEQDGINWTTCYFNRKSSLEVAAKSFGGVERPKNGGFAFTSAQTALEVVESMGGEPIALDSKMLLRNTVLKRNTDGRLVIEVKRDDGDTGMSAWDGTANGKWIRVLNVDTVAKSEDEITYDDMVRVIVSPAGEHAGYMVKSSGGNWDRQSAGNAKKVLQYRGCNPTQADCAMGELVTHRWVQVALPFQPEYPGGRQWNLNAPQFKVQPASIEDDQVPHHPTWDLVLGHIGADLDEPVAKSDWCQKHSIKSGSEWLKHWIAAALRFPFEPTPYLFLHGPEDSGKSILHESLALLLTNGVTTADRALTHPENRNGELAGAVFATVEELDLSKSLSARDRLKEWVTARSLSIRKMRTDTFQQPNTLHFIQCANNPNYCPVWPGDTRIVMCHVPKPATPIAKEDLVKLLVAEAAQFLAAIMQLPMPDPAGRMRVAVLDTADKVAAGHANAPVAQFIAERCRLELSAKIAKRVLFGEFSSWCQDNSRNGLSAGEFGKQLFEFTDRKVEAKGKIVDASGKRVDAYSGIELAIAA